MVRKLGGLVLGVALALVLMMAIEAIGNRVVPLAEARPDDSLPFQSLLPVVIGWFVGTFAGGYVAVWVGRDRWLAWAVAFAIMVGEVIAFVLTPYPAWMIVAGLVLPLLGAWAARLAC